MGHRSASPSKGGICDSWAVDWNLYQPECSWCLGDGGVLLESHLREEGGSDYFFLLVVSYYFFITSPRLRLCISRGALLLSCSRVVTSARNERGRQSNPVIVVAIANWFDCTRIFH